MKNKIFNIFFNKCGTSSLTEAMRLLGYQVVHYSNSEGKIDDIMLENIKKGRKVLHGLEDYNFYSDLDGRMFKKLDKEYPNSKFVVTIREMEGWLNSREKHVKRNQVNPNYRGEWLKVDRERWKDWRNEKCAELQIYFKGRESDLLFIDIPSGEGWETLCQFLDLPIPSGSFPLENKAPSVTEKS